MKYNPRFEYHSIARKVVDGKRLYATPDGKNLPSVTTILDKTKPQKTVESLNRWRKNVGHENAKKITTESANRGTRMHSYIEHYIKNGEIKERGSNPFSWASHSMANLIIKDGLTNVSEFWGVEVPLYYPGIYAGTTDSVGIHCGDESILDYKQTNKPKKREWIDDYFIQLAAYSAAHNELYGTTIKKGVILMCVKPNLDERTGDFVTEPQYQEFVLEGEDFEKANTEWWKRLEQYYLQFG